MAIDTSTPEGRQRELRDISLLQAKKNVQRALDEVNYLIMATESGDRRNLICDAHIELLGAQSKLNQLSSEES